MGPFCLAYGAPFFLRWLRPLLPVGFLTFPVAPCTTRVVLLLRCWSHSWAIFFFYREEAGRFPSVPEIDLTLLFFTLLHSDSITNDSDLVSMPCWLPFRFSPVKRIPLDYDPSPRTPARPSWRHRYESRSPLCLEHLQFSPAQSSASLSESPSLFPFLSELTQGLSALHVPY